MKHEAAEKLSEILHQPVEIIGGKKEVVNV